MSFDTAAANSGIDSSAAVFIEKELTQNMLHLACRHHIHEILLGDVFTLLFGPSRNPDIPMFKCFKQKWSSLCHAQFEPITTDQQSVAILDANKDLANETLSLCFSCLTENSNSRDDYRELMELLVIYLGEKPARGIRFMAPGPLHRARWMHKAIYCLKIFLFRSQLSLSEGELISLSEFNLFVCLVYVSAWIISPHPINAPYNDLSLFKKLNRYMPMVKKSIGEKAFKALNRHTWYLKAELVPLAFFDGRVDFQTKERMIAALQRNKALSKRPLIDLTKVGNLTLADFINKDS